MIGLTAAAAQPPLWDGDGIDPWLPDRLAAEADLVTAERRMYNSWWGSFSDLLVKAHRGVLAGGGMPDPHGVFAAAPAWAKDMRLFVGGPVKDTVGLAFEKLFGGDFVFDQRPQVVAYLAEVENKMVRTPDDVFGRVAAEVARGASAGDSIPKVAERIDALLNSTNAVENWGGRAVTVARTETIGALNFGRYDSFGEMASTIGELMQQQWLSTLDTRCRPAHIEADGQRVPVGTPFLVDGEQLRYPGDKNGSAANVINCVVGNTLVEFPGLRAVTRRWYEGDVVVLSFASGDQLTVTPNHPVLRADGRWTPAGSLHEGDYCIGGAGFNRAPGTPDEDRRPVPISDVYRSANQSGDAERIAGAPPDFHGDGLDGEVQVVAVDGHLQVNTEPATDEEVEDLGLTLADRARAAVRGADRLAMSGQSALRNRQADVALTAGGVRGSGVAPPLLLGERGHPDQVGFGGGAGLQPEGSQPADDGWPAGAQRLRDGRHAFASVEAFTQVVLIDGDATVDVHSFSEGTDRRSCQAQVPVNRGGGNAVQRGERGCRLPRLVLATQLIQVKRYGFAGHVYNLDTGDGWYIANGIATRNCRCTTLLVSLGEQLDMSNRGFPVQDEEAPT